MSTASGFRIAALSPDEVAYYATQRLQGYLMCSASRPGDSCLEPVLFETSYDYTSGAQGRRAVSRRHLCLKHARVFCERYQLALPEAVQP